MPFYGIEGVRGLLIIDRDPWALALYQLDEDQHLKLASQSDLEQSAVLASSVLPLTFRLTSGEQRLSIEVLHIDQSKSWIV